MKTMLLHSLATVFITCALLNCANGFNIDAIKRALGKLENRENTKEPNEKVVNEAIGVVLRLADLNEDGQIGLDELGKAMDDYITTLTGRPNDEAFQSVRDYVMAGAAILDYDNSGVLERTELDRLMQTLLREAGEVEAAKLLENEASMKMALEDVDVPRGRRLVAIFYDAMDTDTDDVITMEEARSFYDHWKNAYYWREVEALAQDADFDGNGRLTRSEVRDWTRLVRRASEWDVRRVFLYTQIKEKLGRALADQWLES